MKLFKKSLSALLIVSMSFSLVGCGSDTKQDVAQQDTSVKEVVDSRGKTVELPEKIECVAILDKGFVTQVMSAFHMQDKIVAQGDLVQKSKTKERDSLVLCPALLDMPNIGYPTSAVDYEAIVESNPDIVILRNSEYIKDSEITQEVIKKIEDDLKIPLVVVNGPGCKEDPKYQDQYEGIKILGEVFDQKEKANQIIDLMQKNIDMIIERTKDIDKNDRPSTMFISGFKDGTVEGTIWGDNYGDGKFVEEICNIKNAYEKHDAMRKASAEEMHALNPDAIVLCTISCEPKELLENPSYHAVQDIQAIKDKKVVSRGKLTWWGDFRLEIPTIMLITAKGVYPDKFEDVNVSEWLNQYHMDLYGIDEETAQEIKIAQGLGWMDEAGF